MIGTAFAQATGGSPQGDTLMGLLPKGTVKDAQ